MIGVEPGTVGQESPGPWDDEWDGRPPNEPPARVWDILLRSAEAGRAGASTTSGALRSGHGSPSEDAAGTDRAPAASAPAAVDLAASTHAPSAPAASSRAASAHALSVSAASTRATSTPAAGGEPVDVVGVSDWGQALAGVHPGGPLASLVDALDPDVLDDGEVVEVVAAAARLEAWAHAQAARWAAVLARRPSMHPWGTPGTRPEDGCVAGDELAMRLATSRRAASALVAEGVAFDGPLVQTGEALRTGSIDPARAAALARRLGPLPVEVTWEVEERVLPTAPTRTVEQLRRSVERALAEIDPEGAADRHRAARSTRRVGRPRVHPDGMASIWCLLPAPDATRIDTLLDCAARTARTGGDPRTLDQLRADGLRDLVLGAGSVGAGSWPDATYGAGLPAGAGRSGTGPDGGGSAPHTSVPAASTGASVASTSASVEPLGATDCLRPHATAVVHVTVSLSTLLGLDDQPADLHGYGPVDAEQARAAAFSAGGVWRRLVTDPLSGAVLDVGRTRYRPPPALVEHVRARDRRCVRPGCDASAERCDIDHTIEYHGRPAGPPAPPGRTSAGNLGPACRRDHRLKTDGGYVLRQPRPGTYVWTTPTGHQYQISPGADDGYLRIGLPGTAPEAGAEPEPEVGVGAGTGPECSDGPETQHRVGREREHGLGAEATSADVTTAAGRAEQESPCRGAAASRDDSAASRGGAADGGDGGRPDGGRSDGVVDGRSDVSREATDDRSGADCRQDGPNVDDDPPF